jgi:peptide/nickel transport system substrate-binding protein
VKQRRGLLFVVLLLTMAMVGAACGSDDNNDNASTPTTSANVPKGGTLVIGAEQEPDCLDFIGSCGGSTWGD